MREWKDFELSAPAVCCPSAAVRMFEDAKRKTTAKQRATLRQCRGTSKGEKRSARRIDLLMIDDDLLIGCSLVPLRPQQGIRSGQGRVRGFVLLKTFLPNSLPLFLPSPFVPKYRITSGHSKGLRHSTESFLEKGSHPRLPNPPPLMTFTPRISASPSSLFDEKLSTHLK